MKYAKMIGLLAVAIAALAAFAASASATVLTSPSGTVYTGAITAVNEGNVSLDGSFVTVTCEVSHVEGNVEQHGTDKDNKNLTVKGEIKGLTFTNKEGKPCNYTVTVVEKGYLEVHAASEITNPSTGQKEMVDCNTVGKINCTGTLTSTGAKVSIATSVGTCVFTTNATDIGTLTPTNDMPPPPAAQTATLDIGAPGGKTGRIPRTEGNFLCGSSGQWTGSYSVTTPDSLYIDGHTS